MENLTECNSLTSSCVDLTIDMLLHFSFQTFTYSFIVNSRFVSCNFVIPHLLFLPFLEIKITNFQGKSTCKVFLSIVCEIYDFDSQAYDIWCQTFLWVGKEQQTKTYKTKKLTQGPPPRKPRKKLNNQIIWQILFNNSDFLLQVSIWIQKISIMYNQWRNIKDQIILESD